MPVPRPSAPSALDQETWRPLPRPGGAEEPLVVRRADPSRMPPPRAGARGAEVLARRGEQVLVRLRHHAPGARAVALHASGWWRPAHPDDLDLTPVADGWWEIVLEVPADWRASYGFVEHHGAGDPPWWQTGLKMPGTPVVIDATAPRSHRAGRGGARSVLAVPDDGPFRPGLEPEERGPELHELPTGPGEPRVRWWATDGTAPGEETALLVVTDGEQHTEHLGTPERLRRGAAAGVLPPLVALFVESGPRRAEVLGVPGGHARWIAESLLPRVRDEGLPVGPGTAAPPRPTRDPARTVVTGSSFGGLTALFTVARAPELVGTAIAQSVSLWRYPQGALVEPLRAAAVRSPLRLRLQAGRYEGSMAASAQALADELRDGPADVTLTVHSGGHDWAWWQPVMLHELGALLR